jgi:AcrR family transcriptional regulator
MLESELDAEKAAETRGDRRKRRNRQALIDAGYVVMSKKGIDAATMLEIAELADVGAGTAYYYFSSKDELAICVIEHALDRLARRINAVTEDFSDPVQVYAFGVRNVMKVTATDHRWRSLLRRSDVIAGAMFRIMGPYAIRDLKKAHAAGRCRVENPELAWRLATYAIVGFSLAVCDREVEPIEIDEAVVDLLGMVGVDRTEAWEVTNRPDPSQRDCDAGTVAAVALRGRAGGQRLRPDERVADHCPCGKDSLHVADRDRRAQRVRPGPRGERAHRRS